MEKTTFKITNFSASPLSFVGVHSLEVPGLCKDLEFTFPEAVAAGIMKRLRSYPHIKVSKVAAEKETAKTSAAEAKKAASTETKAGTKTSGKE